LLEKVADYNSGEPAGNRSINYLSVLALNKLERRDQANLYFKQWMELNRNEKIEEWAILMLENKKSQAAGLFKSVSDGVEGTPWNPPDTDPDFRLVNEIAQKYIAILP
jgi:hypothetical protein